MEFKSKLPAKNCCKKTCNVQDFRDLVMCPLGMSVTVMMPSTIIIIIIIDDYCYLSDCPVSSSACLPVCPSLARQADRPTDRHSVSRSVGQLASRRFESFQIDLVIKVWKMTQKRSDSQRCLTARRMSLLAGIGRGRRLRLRRQHHRRSCGCGRRRRHRGRLCRSVGRLVVHSFVWSPCRPIVRSTGPSVHQSVRQSVSRSVGQ